MTRTGLLLAAALCLGVPSPTPAQTQKIQREVEGKLHQRRLYEDVEIMRRLLHRSLLSAYGPHAAGRTEPLWLELSQAVGLPGGDTAAGGLVDLMSRHVLKKGDHTASHHLSEIEGTYLRGRGVVYTLTLPPPLYDPQPEPARPAAKPLGEWERLRRELRGEKVEAGEGASVRRDRPLADVALKVLADYGHHLTQLAENEQLTVAITFRGQACTVCHHVSGAEGGVGMMGPAGGPGPLVGVRTGTMEPGLVGVPVGRIGATGIGLPGPVGIGEGAAFPGGPTVGQLPGGTGIGTPGGGGTTGRQMIQTLWEKINNHVLLGDLHFKQGRHREAVKAFEEASSQFSTVLRTLETLADIPKQDRLRSYLSGAELYGKLAQAYLSVNENDQALTALKEVAEMSKNAEQLAGPAKSARSQTGAKPGDARPIPLAPKLIISVPKKVLDQVGTGKMTFEEFKKAATVEYLTFGASEGSGSAASGGDTSPTKP